MPGNNITIEVKGLKEIEQALKELGPIFSAKAMAKALRMPMKKVRDRARELVHKRTGTLHDAIDLTPVAKATAARASMADTLSEVGIRIKKIKGRRKAGTGVGGNPRSIWHLVEFGTSHSPAYPYLRPAFDEHEKNMVDEPKQILAKEIERVRRKYARKGRGRRR